MKYSKEEVTPGIYRIKLPLPKVIGIPDYVNVYLIRGGNGYLLVDTGLDTDEMFANLRQQMSEIGADIKEISRIVVTHIHPDHYGQAGRLKKLSGAEFCLHEIEKDIIDARYVHPEKLLEQTGLWLHVNGVPPEELADIQTASLQMLDTVAVAYPDVALHGGETISAGDFSFKVIWTPGHSAGHICLYEPARKVLLAGDFILATITPNVSLHPQSGENPLGEYINALKNVRQLDIKLVLPGHDEPFTQIKDRIDELIHHHAQRSAEIQKALNGNPKNAYQVAGKITWNMAADWRNMPLFHRRLAISESLAHLEMMAVNGRLSKVSRQGIIYYQQN